VTSESVGDEKGVYADLSKQDLYFTTLMVPIVWIKRQPEAEALLAK
jgi:hypothetical protein